MKINAISEDGFIHGIERINEEEFKLGILWHPEKSKISQESIEANNKIVNGFYKAC